MWLFLTEKLQPVKFQSKVAQRLVGQYNNVLRAESFESGPKRLDVWMVFNYTFTIVDWVMVDTISCIAIP